MRRLLTEHRATGLAMHTALIPVNVASRMTPALLTAVKQEKRHCEAAARQSYCTAAAFGGDK
ncbi:hypothetical protein SBBP2_230032 [Burkholderiales bacterium]|nr:hypothetical protein SBBP2_230032 [Burkholderiales bacterium]